MWWSALITDAGRGPYAPEGPPTWVWLFFGALGALYIAVWITVWVIGPKIRKQLKSELPVIAREVERWLRDPEYYAKKK
jgi:hypothetical protein